MQTIQREVCCMTCMHCRLTCNVDHANLISSDEALYLPYDLLHIVQRGDDQHWPPSIVLAL